MTNIKLFQDKEIRSVWNTREGTNCTYPYCTLELEEGND